MKKYTPDIAKKLRPIAAAADDSRGSRKSRTSSDGCSVLDSCTQNTASTARPAAIGPITPRSSHEPASPPLMIPYTSNTRPAIDSSTPGKSTRPGDGLFDSGTSMAMAATAIAVRGTLIKKTDPHQKWFSNTPPVNGPIAIATPTADAQMPMALARFSGSNTVVMTDRVCGDR